MGGNGVDGVRGYVHAGMDFTFSAQGNRSPFQKRRRTKEVKIISVCDEVSWYGFQVFPLGEIEIRSRNWF